MAPSVQHRKVWLTPTAVVPCSNAAKTQKPLKFAGVPQTNETISAASGPKFAILYGRVGEILLFMVALCNRADPLYFHLVSSFFFFLFFSSPNLSGRRLDVYHTLAHGVALVRI